MVTCAIYLKDHVLSPSNAKLPRHRLRKVRQEHLEDGLVGVALRKRNPRIAFGGDGDNSVDP